MPERFLRTLDVAAPVERLWAFHERPDALALLQPPGERIEVIVHDRAELWDGAQLRGRGDLL